jgi:outer membrane protein OmpA-like peptidoglycan-associated protein
MSVNLIELAKSYLTPEVVHKMGGALGESPEHVEKAVGTGLPAILAGFLKMASSPSGAVHLTDLMKQDSPALKQLGGLDGTLSNLGGLLDGGSLATLASYGQTILSALFGGKLSSVLDLITKASGIRSSSASSLMGALAPMLLGLIHKQTADRGLSASGLSELLMSQKDTIAQLAPPGLSGALGLSSLSDLGSAAASRTAAAVGRGATTAAKEASALARWLVPLAALAVLLLGGFYLLRNTGKPVQDALSPVADQTSKSISDAAGTLKTQATQAVKDTGKMVDSAGRTLVETSKKLVPLTLPGNIKLDVPENSFLQGLVKSLSNTADASLPKSFAISDLSFEGAGNALTSESMNTIDSLATVLKAFGTVKIKIAGHTDNAGDPATNKTRSLERATAIKDALVKAGVSADRITVEGVGADHPIASNDTDEGRAKNRRFELSIVTK